MDEIELVAKMKSGDQAAFKAFINANKKKVINICFKFLSNYSDAEDAAQETFVEAYCSIHGFNGNSSLNTWIYRLAVNKSIDALRKNNRRQRIARFISFFSEEFKNDKIYFQSEDNPIDEYESAEIKNIVRNAIAAMPENQKIALTLIKLEDISHKDAAEIMGISLGAVESLLFRAKKNLKYILERKNVFQK